MAQRGGQNFWQGRFGNLVGRGIDAIAKGNNFNPATGQFNRVVPGLLARAGQVGATALFGPVGGLVAGQLGNNLVDTGRPLDFSQNTSNLGDVVNFARKFISAQQGNQDDGQIGPVTRQPIRAFGGLNITNLPGVSVQAPQFGGTEAAWSGLGTGTGNIFSGGSLGNWASQASPRSYGQSGGSFTPFGAGTIQIAGEGFGGQSAAQGFGLGSGGSGSSAGADALSDALRAARKNRV